MDVIKKFMLLFFTAAFISFQINAQDKNDVIHPFTLPSADGKVVSMNDYPDAKGFIIVFTSNHCPFAKLYFERLNKLNLEYSILNVPLLAIRSTDTSLMEADVMSRMTELANKEGFSYPYLADDDQKVAKEFNAQKTPHAFVIWKENNRWVIKYSGAVDDNGAEPEKVVHAYVKQAVDSLLAGKEVAIKNTKSVGCQIKFRK